MKKSRYSEESGVTIGWRLCLLGYVALLIVNLISPEALASSFTTGLGDVSRDGSAIQASTFSADWSTGMNGLSRDGAAGRTSIFSADWSKTNGFDHTSRTSVESRSMPSATFHLLVWLAALLASVPMLIVMLEALAVLGFRPRRVTVTPDQELPRTVVLIPAHNEASVVGRCLASLAADRPPNCRWLVVAHNCTDTTAALARSLGSEVLEVQDAGRGGKPDALKAGLRWLDANPPEVVVIVDADCVVSPGAVRMLATRAHMLHRPVMGAYFFAPANTQPGLATFSSLAVLLRNYIRPLGLHTLGLPCLLNGSGSAYPFSILRQAPHGAGAIAEDYQLAIDLLQQGYPTAFVPEARIDGQLPPRTDTALRQRRRWEHGHLFLAFRTAPRLLLAGLARRDKHRLGLALEVAVPPLAFLGLMWTVAAGLAILQYVLYGQDGALGLLLGSATTFTSAVLIAWMRFAGIKPTIIALAAAPRYLLWKMPMYRDFFTCRETRWVKTARDSFNSAQHEVQAPISG
ncbi:MAG: glycosyltransferase family 2 protein [Sulfuricaulis sp.]